MRVKIPTDPTCPIRKIQKMRHIHTTVGAVVSCRTFRRGSGCLTLSNVSRRVGARKSWHKPISAEPSPMEPSKFGAN